MSDERLRELERAHADDPTDRYALERLQDERVRSGLGWHGERKPPSLYPLAGERGVYGWFPDYHAHWPLLEMVYVPGGDVECWRCDGGRRAYVTPDMEHRGCVECYATPGRRRITPFYIGRFPVTWGEWWGARVFDEVGRRRSRVAEGFASGYDHRPLVNVSLDDARAFCARAGLRLPSEAEWRWAALGASICHACAPFVTKCQHAPGHMKPRLYPWGNERPSAERCVWARHPEFGPRHDTDGASRLHEFQGSTAPVVVEGCVVCQGRSNACACSEHPGNRRLWPARPAGASWCGAADLAGNVMEWVEAGRPAAMGGCFRSSSADLRASLRHAWNPSFQRPATDDTGFRVALSAA
jgi:formylglycine-generating enzyme required for sulfatase activity